VTADEHPVEQVIRDRRTSLLVDREAPVADDLIDRLIEAATWAPNHKRTWPWRFTVVSGDSRGRLGLAMAEAGAELGLDPAKVEKLPTKYERSAVVLLVWVHLDGDEVRQREDRDATAAAVQNLLLTATAHDLGNYWATIPDALVPAVRRFAEVDDTHDPVALVYLGWPTGSVTAPERPAPVVTYLD
jgi:nitroreductase